MLNEQQINRLKELINEHVKASIDASWPGHLPMKIRFQRIEQVTKTENNLYDFIHHIDGSSKRIGS